MPQNPRNVDSNVCLPTLYEALNSKNWENFQYVPHLKFNFKMKLGFRNYPGSKKSTQARPIISTTLIGGFSTHLNVTLGSVSPSGKKRVHWDLSQSHVQEIFGIDPNVKKRGFWDQSQCLVHCTGSLWDCSESLWTEPLGQISEL